MNRSFDTIMDSRIASTSITSLPLTGTQLARRATAPQDTQEVDFSQAFKNALQAVSDAQERASGLQREVQLENPNVSIEETMVATQKAQIGFQATLNVRNRLVQAYTDIMNMQV
jgi:flagellar hook-basal body complex protein FliE